MRIVSDFHDYYDSVQKYGQDKSVFYLRKKQELTKDGVKKKFPGKYDEIFDIKLFSDYRVANLNKSHFQLLFFCGTIYPMILLERYDYIKTDYFRIFNNEDFQRILKDEFDEKVLKEYIVSMWSRLNKEAVQKLFSFKDKQSDLNVDLKCPVILLDYNKQEIELNPVLKDIQFYVEVETGLAFQKIESFISGVLASPQMPMLKVSEKTRLEKRGFDSKLSFRKGKSSQKD